MSTQNKSGMTQNLQYLNLMEVLPYLKNQVVTWVVGYTRDRSITKVNTIDGNLLSKIKLKITRLRQCYFIYNIF